MNNTFDNAVDAAIAQLDIEVSCNHKTALYYGLNLYKIGLERLNSIINCNSDIGISIIGDNSKYTIKPYKDSGDFINRYKNILMDERIFVEKVINKIEELISVSSNNEIKNEDVVSSDKVDMTAVNKFCTDNDFKFTIGSHGELIMYSKDRAVDTLPDDIAYKDCEFITIDKRDAVNICLMIESVIDEKGLVDYEIFGGKALSFERLYDRIDGLIYPKSVYAKSNSHVTGLEEYDCYYDRYNNRTKLSKIIIGFLKEFIDKISNEDCMSLYNSINNCDSITDVTKPISSTMEKYINNLSEEDYKNLQSIVDEYNNNKE